MSETYIGLDIGGTNIKAAVVDEQGRILRRDRTETPASEGPEAVAAAGAELARRLCEGDYPTPAGLGAACAGMMDAARTTVLFSPNLPGWEDVPLGQMLENKSGMPCTLENDANAAALGEYWRGAGRGTNVMVQLTLGTGIGGGVVLGGRTLVGNDGMGSELGHMTLEPDGPTCGCGRQGCMEALASATAVARRMREMIDEGRSSILEGRDDITARDVYDAVCEGDEAAQENFRTTAYYLGMGISNLLYIFNPGAVVLSGGMAAAGDVLLDPIREEVHDRSLDILVRNLRICQAELGDDAGPVGAARAFLNRHVNND